MFRKFSLLLIVMCAAFIQDVNAQQVDSVAVQKLIKRYACGSCHMMKPMQVGPSWPQIAARKHTQKEFIALTANPKPENWPDFPPMAPMGYVPEKDLILIYQWVKTLEK